VIDARQRLVFEHVHPTFGKAETDAVYQRQNDPREYEFGKLVFERRNAELLAKKEGSP